MSKIVGLVLLLVAAVVLVPSLRDKVRPHVQFAFDPFYTWSAKNRVSEIMDVIKGEQSLGRPIPNPREFGTFIERNDFREDAAYDPWGNPYYLVVNRTTYQVGSYGKDQELGTEDDILSREETIRSTPGTRRR
jgi:hypothetical protein